MADGSPILEYTASTSPRKVIPYESSLAGEYIRLLLLLTAAPLLCDFAYFAANHQTGFLCLIANAILLVTLLSTRGFQALRILVLVLMAANVFAFAINPDNTYGLKKVEPSQLTVFALVACLALASIFEFTAWLNSKTRTTVLKTFAWGMLLIPALVYVLGVPLFESIWTTLEGDEKKLALQDPNWNVINESAFRAAKLAVFGFFTYLGACIGSFLNVVAHCVPRGEGVGLRDSKCPSCNTKIGRIDNLPIFSYINLGAKCRSCDIHISARYLIVEIVVATIFGSLFLYELVTGCQNIPLINISNKGILWVILYPRWPAIGIYFFHAFFMSVVLVLALMEWDKQQLKRTFASLVGVCFFLAAAVYLPSQPIPLLEHLPGVSFDMVPWAEQLLKLTTGGVLGAIAGYVLGKFFTAEYSSHFTFAFFLAGLVLGWQALLQVVLVFLALWLIAKLISRMKSRLPAVPTTLLLVANFVHHPFWKLVADLWRFN